MGFFDKLKEGLKKTRANFTDGMEQIFNSYVSVSGPPRIFWTICARKCARNASATRRTAGRN